MRRQRSGRYERSNISSIAEPVSRGSGDKRTARKKRCVALEARRGKQIGDTKVVVEARQVLHLRDVSRGVFAEQVDVAGLRPGSPPVRRHLAQQQLLCRVEDVDKLWNRLPAEIPLGDGRPRQGDVHAPQVTRRESDALPPFPQEGWPPVHFSQLAGIIDPQRETVLLDPLFERVLKGREKANVLKLSQIPKAGFLELRARYDDGRASPAIAQKLRHGATGLIGEALEVVQQHSATSANGRRIARMTNPGEQLLRVVCFHPVDLEQVISHDFEELANTTCLPAARRSGEHDGDIRMPPHMLQQSSPSLFVP